MGGAAFPVKLKDGATGPARRMGAALDTLTRKLNKLERSLDRVQGKSLPALGRKLKGAKTQLSEFDKSQKKLARASSGSGGLGTGLRNIAIGAAVAGAAVGGLLAKKLYELTDIAGRSSLAFKNMFGNEVAGEAQITKAIELANKFGFGVGETIRQVQKFNSLGFNAAQSEELVKMGGDMRALGNSSEQIRRVFLQLGQIRSKGKLQGEELIVLAENGVNLGMVYERLSKKLKKPVSEIRKMQESGDLPAGAALNSIAETILITLGKQKLGQAGEEAANNTVGGVVGLIGTKLETGMFNAAKKAEPALTRGLQAIDAGLANIGDAGGGGIIVTVLESIGSLLEKIGPKLPEIVDSFSKAFGTASGFDGSGIQSFADALPGIASSLGSIAGALVQIGLAIPKDPLVNGVASAALTTGKILFDNNAVGDKAAELSKKAQEAGFFGTVANIFGTRGEQFGTSLTTGIAKGIGESTGVAEQAARQMAASVDAASRDELGVHSPSKAFAETGGNAAEGMAYGMVDSSDVAIGSARSLSRAVLDSSARALQSTSNNYGGITASAAESMSSSRSRSSIHIGEIKIIISGSSNPEAAGQNVLSTLDAELAGLLDRHMQGVGAR